MCVRSREAVTTRHSTISGDVYSPTYLLDTIDMQIDQRPIESPVFLFLQSGVDGDITATHTHTHVLSAWTFVRVTAENITLTTSPSCK